MPVTVRKGHVDVKLTRPEFERRVRQRFVDPGIEAVERQLADVIDVTWFPDVEPEDPDRNEKTSA